MTRRSQVARHPRRAEIEAMLAAKAPLAIIAERYGVSEFAASRHRTRLKREQFSYWRQLRSVLLRHGVTKSHFTGENQWMPS